ncbi:peptide ABC transporter substrate-binding protein [Blastococcus saxobsidens]|uniref:peptide ABC transporter substrate-binding protein n=1 Tax=Blastococcus saxobsidens TaxID=138336 RepID=UPI001B80B057|nr:ABC transporter substrate-binding protein [Blastococcus saxobsidens]
MNLSKRRGALVAASITAAMVLSACGGSDEGGEGGAGGEAGGTFSMYINEPENPLVPGNTTESEGSQVVKSLWTGLIQYGPEGEAEFSGVAESIESEDNVTWTVTLNDGWTFHDGTPVTAQSFVDAWNYTAYSPNAQGASYFFSNIEGYEDLQAPTDEEGNVTGEPAATEMSGLEVVDDTTFTVTLTGPFAQFPVTVGYNAFFPLPESFFEDPEAAGKNPIGNGPFKADGEFVPGQGITLSKYEDYAGENEAQADGVEYKVFADLNTAYTEVQAGGLDITRDVPPDAITTAADEFGDRFLESPSSQFTYVGFPTYDPRYQDKRVRQAFSLAIDREQITDAIFNGTRAPADAAIAPVVDGYREGACEYCEVDVDRANQLLDEAGFDRSQPVELWFNSGAGHDAWMEAVGNQLRENLGVEYQLRGDLDFSQYLPLLDEKGITGPFRLAWAMDYPSPQNYLEPLYSTAALPPAGSNASFYSNPEFDELVAQGNQASSNEEAIEFYNQAEDVLLEDMPIIPMFFGLEQAVHSENVSGVFVDIFGQVDTSKVTVNN